MPRSAHKLALVLTILLLIVGQTYLITPQKVFAADGINQQINFQGKVVNSNGTNVNDGSYNFVFKIYSAASGGSPIWTETRSGGNQVAVQAGIFRVSLGSVQSLPGSVNFNSDSLYLGIEFNGDGEMTPRVRFASVPYAFNAGSVNGLTVTNTTGNPFSTTTTFQIADGKTFVVNNGLTFSGTDSTTFTFPSTTGVVVTEAFTQTLTNKTIGSTGLVFSGATTDITTGVNEVLGISPNGVGNVLINPTAGGQAALIIDKLGNNDIFTASAAGATRFTINNVGAIGLTSGFGLSTQCLTSNGSGAAASWGACGSGGGNNYWQLNGPVLSPGNSTVDFAIGGTSTASAKFAVLGVSTGNPTASVSAGLNGGAFITAAGNLATTANQTLSLGGSTTGLINLLNSSGNPFATFNPNNGTLGLGTTTSNSPLAIIQNSAVVSAYIQNFGGNTTIALANDLGREFDISMLNSASTPANAAILNQTYNAPLRLMTNDTPRLEITGNGNIGFGTTSPLSELHVTRALSAGATGKALAIFDQIENQDIFTASAGGQTRFVINGAGAIGLVSGFGSSTQCLTSNGSGAAASWGACGGGGGANYFQLNNNLLSPSNSTYDFAIGGTSTASAKFAVLNVAGGTPTASVSGNLVVDRYNGAGGFLKFGANGDINLQYLPEPPVLTGMLDVTTSKARTSQDSILYIDNTSATNQYQATGLRITTNATVADTTLGLMGLNLGTGDWGFVDVSGSGGTGLAIDVGTSANSAIAYQSAIKGSDQTGIKLQNASTSTNGNLLWLQQIATGGTAPLALKIESFASDPIIRYAIRTGGNAKTQYLWNDVANQPFFITNSSDSNTFSFTYGSNVLSEQTILSLKGSTQQFSVGATSSPIGKFQVEGSYGSNSLAVFNEVGSSDILTASASGVTKFTIKNDGTASTSAGLTIDSAGGIQTTKGQTLTIGGDTTGNITIAPNNGTGTLIVGSAVNGLTFDVSDGPTYTGTARPLKSIVLSPEYAGATLTTDGSSNTNGSMTADNTLNAGGVGWKNYYEWSSTQGSLQDYTVTVRVAIPQDFDSWQIGGCGGSSCALEIAYQTGVSGTTHNAVSVQLNNAETTPGTVICTIAAVASTSWTTTGCTSTDLATTPTWNTAGDVAIIRIKLAADSTSSALARVGDITLRYYARY